MAFCSTPLSNKVLRPSCSSLSWTAQDGPRAEGEQELWESRGRLDCNGVTAQQQSFCAQPHSTDPEL